MSIDLKTLLVVCGSVGLGACTLEATDAPPDAELRKARQELSSTIYYAMSLNVRIPEDSGERHWDNREPHLAKTIAYWRPAVIALQELRSSTHSSLHGAVESETGIDYFWYWVDRGDGERIAIWVDRASFYIEAYGYWNVSNSARDDSCGLFDDEDSKNRPIQYVRAIDRFNGRRTYFFNTHFPSKNSCERHGMASIFADKISGRSDQAARVLAMGDFNDGYESSGRLNGSTERLLTEAGLLSTYAEAHYPMSSYDYLTVNGWNKTSRRGRMIDHIMVNEIGATIYGYVDRNMFTSAGLRVWCSYVDSSGYCGSYRASTLELYSDHWAVAAAMYR